MSSPDFWLMFLTPVGFLAMALVTVYFASSSR